MTNLQRILAATVMVGVATAQQAAMFSVGRVGRVVRQKSIQLSKAIQSVANSDDSRRVDPAAEDGARCGHAAGRA